MATVKKPVLESHAKKPVEKAPMKNRIRFNSLTEALNCAELNKPGPCPICGAKSSVIINNPEPFVEDNTPGLIIACTGGKAKDGGATFCGAQMATALGFDGYIMQLMRWNRKLA